MKKLLKAKSLQTMVLLILLTLVGLQACKKENFSQTTDESVNITGYLEEDLANYSEFLKILKLTGVSSYLGAYGTYTLFTPTNDAIKNYLSDIGKSSLEDVNVETLKDLVRLHLIEDTISTTAFTDGKIAVATMLGQYLTTGAQNEGGVTKITINKISRIVKSNIRVGNGIIHAIDRVLIPSTRTLAEEIEANSSLTIFAEALKATGWDAKLNKPLTFVDSVGSYVSVLAETDAVYRENGINSFADLKAKYSHTGDPANPSDSLNLYIAYRVLPGLKYMADIVSATSHVTSAPLEVITVKLSKDTILFNEETFGGVLEKGVVADRVNSDVTTKNGVLHFVKGDFFIKSRMPTPVYWDVADQPEIRQLPGIFRQPGKGENFVAGKIKDIALGGAATNIVSYAVTNTGSTAGSYFSDYLDIYIRTAVVPWVEFKTPVVIKGKYKVWISFRAMGSKGNVCSATIDGVPLSRTVNFGEYRNTTLSPAELEAQGYKNNLTFSTSNWNCRFLGIIDIQTTDRHIFRLDALSNSNVHSLIDMIQFIPVDMDQLNPKFGPNGEVVYQ